MQGSIDFDATTGHMLWLPAASLTRINGRARLRVTRGLVWLTIDGQPDDHLLSAGDRFTLRRGDHALLQALDATAGVEVVEPARASWRQWAAALLRGAERRLAGALA